MSQKDPWPSPSSNLAQTVMEIYALSLKPLYLTLEYFCYNSNLSLKKNGEWKNDNIGKELEDFEVERMKPMTFKESGQLNLMERGKLYSKLQEFLYVVGCCKKHLPFFLSLSSWASGFLLITFALYVRFL